MKKCLFLLLFSLQLSVASDLVWSKTGHRVVGEIASQHLSKKAAKAIDAILDGQSLAEASTFADEIKSDTLYRKFSAWHYVNYPANKKYGDQPPSADGDLLTGIEQCLTILSSADSSKKEKAFYLRLLVHLVGDLHQPLHVGRLEDKGGNDIQLQWFGKGTNLHRVWDSNLIDNYDMSYTELANNLPRLSKTEKKAIVKGTIYDWAEESQDLANKVYESIEIGENLSYRYSYDWWDTVELQLEKGGLRLAIMLNDLF